MSLDVVTIGRVSVDLYGAQIGGRLEDMRSFRKYVGGSPANMAIGAARLGLNAALISAVGDEHMGRFIREELARAGVDDRGLKTDPGRLTALVLLGVRDEARFPLIFYREACADMGLTEADIDAGLIGEARAVVATGTHLSHPATKAAVLKALRLARERPARTALDIDYRPNLWGVAGHGEGESRYVEAEAVTAALQETLPLFDLIVGTEEEFHIAGGATDTLAALRAVRALSPATLVCKRGPMGAVAFPGPIPARLDEGETGPGFAVEVFNVLGAGDGFMAGLLKGWLDDAGWPEALRIANACGALAVSRHGCAPAYPSLEELVFFLERGVARPDLRNDRELAHIHWASATRRGDWPRLRVFAFDDDAAFRALAEGADVAHARIRDFKRLCLAAARAGADGVLCDDGLGRAALYDAAEGGLWVARPAAALDLEAWPAVHTVWAEAGDAEIARIATAARAQDLELAVAGVGDVATLERLYGLGLRPDWWALGPDIAEAAAAIVATRDPHCRGLLLTAIEGAASADLVKGFVAGADIFAEPARAWFAGEIGDAAAIAAMVARLEAKTRAFQKEG